MGMSYLDLGEVEVYSARRASQIQEVGVTSWSEIPSTSFTASSSRTGNEPDQARLNFRHSDTPNRAWLPSTNSNPSDYLQIHLQYVFFRCAVATQGNPNADQWTTKYKLLLSLDKTTWITYKENGTEKIFNGNNGRNDVVKHNLVETARASIVRFQPTEFRSHKALRVELYGTIVPAVPYHPPKNLSLTAQTSTSVIASWQRPSKRKITGYKLFYRKQGSQDSLTILTTSRSGATVAKLIKYAKYEFKVLAFNHFGDGPNSSFKVVRTKEDAPRNLTATARSSTSVVTTWQLPATDFRNGTIKGFKLFYKRKRSDINSTTTLLFESAKILSKTISGLDEFTEYEFQVLAFTSVGDGPKSAVVITRTKEDDPAIHTAGFSLEIILTLAFSIGGLLLFAILLAVGFKFCKKRKQQTKRTARDIQHLDVSEIPPIRTECIEELGQGAFGKVKKAKLKDGLQYFVNEQDWANSNRKEKIVAVKELHENANEEQRKEFLDEIDLMKEVGKHPNVLSFLGCWTTAKPLQLIIEYIPHGDLLHWLRRKRSELSGSTLGASLVVKDEKWYAGTREQNRTDDQENEGEGQNSTEEFYKNTHPCTSKQQQECFNDDNEHSCSIPMIVFSAPDQDEDAEAPTQTSDDECDQDCNSFHSIDILKFAWQIARGMRYLSGKGLVHRDLAARNILVGHGKRLKIGDFGLMRQLYSEVYEGKKQKKLPIKWMAPEAILDVIFSVKSDVWSYGVVLWEIGSLGGSPYPLWSHRQIMRRLREGYRMEKPDICPESFYSLMTDCWKETVHERPNFEELENRVERMLLQEVEYFDMDKLDESKEYYNVQDTTTAETSTQI